MERHILTADQAADLIPNKPWIRTVEPWPDGSMIGCVVTEYAALDALANAAEIELGDDACRAAGFPIVVTRMSGKHSYFEADMDMLTVIERAAA